VRKAKQQTDAEWKAKVLRKLKDLGKLQGLKKNIWRITVVLEKIAGIEGEDSNEEQISWLESKREITEVQGSREKEKQKEERIDGTENEEEGMERQKEDNEMESVEEGDSSFSLIAYSVGTGV